MWMSPDATERIAAPATSSPVRLRDGAAGAETGAEGRRRTSGASSSVSTPRVRDRGPCRLGPPLRGEGTDEAHQDGAGRQGGHAPGQGPLPGRPAHGGEIEEAAGSERHSRPEHRRGGQGEGETPREKHPPPAGPGEGAAPAPGPGRHAPAPPRGQPTAARRQRPRRRPPSRSSSCRVWTLADRQALCLRRLNGMKDGPMGNRVARTLAVAVAGLFAGHVIVYRILAPGPLQRSVLAGGASHAYLPFSLAI